MYSQLQLVLLRLGGPSLPLCSFRGRMGSSHFSARSFLALPLLSPISPIRGFPLGWSDAGRGQEDRPQRSAPRAAATRLPSPVSGDRRPPELRSTSAFVSGGNHASYRKLGLSSWGASLCVYACFLAPELLRELIGSLAPRRSGSPRAAAGPRPLARPSATLSRCLSLGISFPSTPPCPPPPRLRLFPLPPAGAPNLSWQLPGRQADTRQIGIRERKGGKSYMYGSLVTKGQ